MNIAWKYAFEASKPHFDADVVGTHQHGLAALHEHYGHTLDLYIRCCAARAGCVPHSGHACCARSVFGSAGVTSMWPPLEQYVPFDCPGARPSPRARH